MARLLEADFYFGSVLMSLFRQGIKPALIENGSSRQVFDFTTDHKDFRWFLKYRSQPTQANTAEYQSWQFAFSKNDINEIEEYLNSALMFNLVLICGKGKLNESEYAILEREDIEEFLSWNKLTLTIGRKLGERRFRIIKDRRRDESILIKTNRIF